MSTPALRLKKDQERRLLAGHSWVYSNEVDTEATPLKAFEPGQPVEILSQRGRWLGFGYVNPHSLICARVVSHDRDRLAVPAQGDVELVFRPVGQEAPTELVAEPTATHSGCFSR